MPRRPPLRALPALALFLFAGGCTSAATYRVTPGPVPPGALPVNPHGLGFVTEEGRRLIRAVAWIEPKEAEGKNRGALENRTRAAAATLVERFRNELESRWAATPHDAAQARCNDGSTQCWLWVDACTLKSATLVDRFDEGGLHVGVTEIDLTTFVICIEKQKSLAEPEAKFVLGAVATAHATLSGPEVAAELTSDLEARWQHYKDALARGETPTFDAGKAVAGGPAPSTTPVARPAAPTPPVTLPAADARTTPEAATAETEPPAAQP